MSEEKTYADLSGHIEYKCVNCTILGCPYCDGGLFLCTRCGCREGTLPSTCPGVLVPMDRQDLIYDGKLDYHNGIWVDRPSGSVSTHYNIPGLPEIQA